MSLNEDFEHGEAETEWFRLSIVLWNSDMVESLARWAGSKANGHTALPGG